MPSGIINIVDASNLERNLCLTMQLMELGIPMVLALNMIIMATRTLSSERDRKMTILLTPFMSCTLPLAWLNGGSYEYCEHYNIGNSCGTGFSCRKKRKKDKVISKCGSNCSSCTLKCNKK